MNNDKITNKVIEWLQEDEDTNISDLNSETDTESEHSNHETESKQSNTDEEFKQIFVKYEVTSVQIYLFNSYTKCFLLVMLRNWQ